MKKFGDTKGIDTTPTPKLPLHVRGAFHIKDRTDILPEKLVFAGCKLLQYQTLFGSADPWTLYDHNGDIIGHWDTESPPSYGELLSCTRNPNRKG